MAGTRSSSRLSSSQKSADEPASSPAKAGTKRKADATDSPKGKKDAKVQKQQTIEESLDQTDDAPNTEIKSTDNKTDGEANGANTNGNANGDKAHGKSDTQAEEAIGADDQPTDIEMLDAATNGEGTDKQPGEQKDAKEKAEADAQKQTEEPEKKDDQNKIDEDKPKSKETNGDKAPESNGDKSSEASADKPSETNGDKAADSDEKPTSKSEEAGPAKTESKSETSGDAIEKSSQREQAMPSSILEKGIIYFVTRGRVGIEDPDSVQDLQRTHMVLRPIPHGAKLGEGSVHDSKNVRLIALPKKVFPKSGKDKFMAFVEKAGVSMKELKDEFFGGSEYDTKTVGTRQAPPVAPVGEGVYALVYANNASHLVYMMTLPKEISEVQKDMGLYEQGSFVTSLKNPEVSGPSYASLPEKPDFPQEFIKDFGGRGWQPVQKKEYFDYANAQFLLIGEDSIDNAVEATEKDQKHDKETPLEELEKLEQEDEHRVDGLSGSDAIYEDLGISRKDYPDVMTTW